MARGNASETGERSFSDGRRYQPTRPAQSGRSILAMVMGLVGVVLLILSFIIMVGVNGFFDGVGTRNLHDSYGNHIALGSPQFYDQFDSTWNAVRISLILLLFGLVILLMAWLLPELSRRFDFYPFGIDRPKQVRDAEFEQIAQDHEDMVKTWLDMNARHAGEAMEELRRWPR